MVCTIAYCTWWDKTQKVSFGFTTSRNSLREGFDAANRQGTLQAAHNDGAMRICEQRNINVNNNTTTGSFLKGLTRVSERPSNLGREKILRTIPRTSEVNEILTDEDSSFVHNDATDHSTARSSGLYPSSGEKHKNRSYRR